jgi:signal transduction histidine kinase
MYSEIIKIKDEKKLLTLIVDITEIRKYEEALELSEQQLRILNNTKDKFFSVIAHDLQNPLNVLTAYCNETLSHLKSKNIEKTEKYIYTIKSIAENTGNLIQNLLSWARVQTGLIKYHPEQISAYTLLNNELMASKPFIESKHIQLHYVCDKNLIIEGDVNMLSTILRNLISNAIKFTDSGGKVKVEIEKSGSLFKIIVSDTGIGISEKAKQSLFKIGEIVYTKGTNDEIGTGLGLILCVEFISLHKGNIKVESTLGKGSKFIAEWPVNNI